MTVVVITGSSAGNKFTCTHLAILRLKVSTAQGFIGPYLNTKNREIFKLYRSTGSRDSVARFR